MKTTSLTICATALLVAAFLGSGCYHVEGPEVSLVDLLEDECESVIEGQVHVRIHIDGRSWVVLRGDELWLVHYDFAAPGRHEGANHPTVVDGEEWIPEWPFGPPPDEGRDCGGCETIDRFYLDQQLPTEGEMVVELDVLESRGSTTLVLEPTPAADNAVAVQLNDNPPSGSVWYEVIVHWAACEPPEPISATLAI